MSQKTVRLPLVVFGVLLIVIACVVVFVNFNMTRDQIQSNVSISQIFSNYFLMYGIAIFLTLIGLLVVRLGLRR